MVKTAWEVNAGWEVKKGKAICRWFVCWSPAENADEFVGAVAGYSGGGAFEVERFYGRLKKEKLTALWIDYTDRLTDKEIDFESLDEKKLGLCEQALELVWQWNDEDAWLDTDEVILRREMKGMVAVSGDMLTAATKKPPYVHKLCELAGLTAGPGE